MKAIVTKYHGPTNSRGSRIWACADGLRASVEYDNAHSADVNHMNAAMALCSKLGWTGTLIMGSLGDSERVFVWVETLVPTDAVGMRTYVEVFNGIEVR